MMHPPFTEIDYHLVVIHGDIEPEIIWYVDEESRDAAAIEHRRKDPEKNDGLFKLDVVNGDPEMSAYSNGFFWDALGMDGNDGKTSF